MNVTIDRETLLLRMYGDYAAPMAVIESIVDQSIKNHRMLICQYDGYDVAAMVFGNLHHAGFDLVNRETGKVLALPDNLRPLPRPSIEAKDMLSERVKERQDSWTIDRDGRVIAASIASCASQQRHQIRG